MIEIVDKIKALFQTFDQSGRAALRDFLRRNSRVEKWHITADFCLHDTDRPNDVFAFSIIPYDTEFDIIRSQINEVIPKDWKKSKEITPQAIDFLRDKRRFHIAFVFPHTPQVFNNGDDTNPLEIARQSVAITVDQLIAQGRTGDSLRRLKALKQESKANRFNVELLSDLYVLSDLFCFVTLTLARERNVEVVGWLPDRDKMTTWCGGVLFDIGVQTLMGLSEHFKIPVPEKGPLIAGPTPGAGKDAMWYDELVRLPDYVAGILSAWNFETNEIPAERDKYRVMAQDFAAFAQNIMVFKVRYDTAFQAGRIVFGPLDTQTRSA